MKYAVIILLCAVSIKTPAQKVQRIFFNLYTDSLKKGEHNYINVVAKLSDGRYLPLNAEQLILRSNYGIWDRNDLILDTAFTGKNVIITAFYKENPTLRDSATVYIKTLPDTTRLKTIDEIFGTKDSKKKPR